MVSELKMNKVGPQAVKSESMVLSAAKRFAKVAVLVGKLGCGDSATGGPTPVLDGGRAVDVGAMNDATTDSKIDSVATPDAQSGGRTVSCFGKTASVLELGYDPVTGMVQTQAVTFSAQFSLSDNSSRGSDIVAAAVL